MPSAKQLERSKNRKSQGQYLALPRNVTGSEKFIKLSAHAVKLLVDLGRQYHGKNNGDLCMTWSMMKNRGWKSQDTLNKARKELVDTGFIMLTRQGGMHQPSLYAITWQKIDECGGKLEVRATTAPPANWLDS